MDMFYNDIEPYNVEWMRNLVAAGHISAGHVDGRSIADIAPADIVRYRRVHFFAGIGGWDFALQLAGWPLDAEVWTGSCPCQPFSIIAARRPAVVVGEQVSSPAGYRWLDLVFDDFERAGYACRAAVLPAACVGAPQPRHRIFWRADLLERPDGIGRLARGDGHHARNDRLEPASEGPAGELADGSVPGLEGHAGHGDDCHEPGRLGPDPAGPTPARGAAGPLAGAHGGVSGHADVERFGEHRQRPAGGGAGRQGDQGGGREAGPGLVRYGSAHDFWGYPDWLFCPDGCWRPIEPGLQPLADGVSRGVVRLRTGNTAPRRALIHAFGNAIVPQVAAQFLIATRVPL